MGKGILICGLNGCGKSTLGKALGERLGYTWIDIEDCYFPKEDPAYLYAAPRTKEEAVEILREKIRRSRRFVLSAVKGDFGEDIESSYMGVVLLQAGQEVRMRRVRERSYEKFGERMLPGGDLYKKEEGFFVRVAQRSEEDIAGWVSGLSVPVLVLDGERPISEHLERISTFLHLK